MSCDDALTAGCMEPCPSFRVQKQVCFHTMRFEVVSAPVEHRLQATFQHQTDVAIETLYGIMESVNSKTNATLNTTIAAVSDPVYMKTLYDNARLLLAPSSIPGALLVAAPNC
jgi:hypothetical protein